MEETMKQGSQQKRSGRQHKPTPHNQPSICNQGNNTTSQWTQGLIKCIKSMGSLAPATVLGVSLYAFFHYLLTPAL